MNAVDTMRKHRNVLALVAITAGGASLGSAIIHGPNFWKTAIDYWLLWSAFLFGVGGFASFVGALFCHLIADDMERSN